MCLLGPEPCVWRGVSVLCVGALRWGICLKGLVVARLTCLCFGLCFVRCWTMLGLWDSCACFFCWAIAGSEYSFLLIFGFDCSVFWGSRGAWSVFILVEECGGWVISLLMVK